MLSNKDVEKIVEKYYSDIRSFCLSRAGLSTDAADDITQDVFLLLQEKHKTLEDTNIRAWLYSVAANKLMEFYREKTKFSNYLSINDNEAVEQMLYISFEQCIPVDFSEIESYKEHILKSLTPTEAELYEKIYIFEKSYRKIGEELGLSENAVNIRALRLRNKIKKTVNEMY